MSQTTRDTVTRGHLDPQAIGASHLRESLSRVLDDVEHRGCAYTIERNGVPVAEIRPLSGAVVSHTQDATREDRAPYVAEAEGSLVTAAAARIAGSPAAAAVLGVFFLEPDRAMYQRDVARRADVALRSAQLALERLESLGFVTSSRDGNRRYYRAVRSRRFEDLRRALAPDYGIVRILADALAPLRESIEWAFVFGSVASGDDRLDSDVDLMIIGDVPETELFPAIAEVERQLGREVSITWYQPTQFRERAKDGNHFVTAVLAGARLDVLGEAIV